ncbi:g4707 [Coccomyxa elongata]
MNGTASVTGTAATEADTFLSKAAGILTDYVASRDDRAALVTRLAAPEELYRCFDQLGTSLRLGDNENPVTSEQLLAAMQVALNFSTRTCHPLFFNQLYGGPEPVGIAGEWLAVATNTNAHTYEVAPVFTLAEIEVLAKMARVVGGAYAQTHDGLFVPGGSIANLYGMHLARNRADPEFKRRGAVGGPCLVAFTSAHAHYSYMKAATMTGLGSDNLIVVPCAANGSMFPAALEAAIVAAKERGGIPFFVGSTAGTTVLGAFDPLPAISEICERHKLWHHVDGTWGAAVLLSRTHRDLMAGCERSDSLSWNPHKMMGLPLQCSVFLTQHEGILKRTNASGASYLFQPDKLHSELDLGDKTIQCGRRPDAFKLWFAWKAYGDGGYESRLDHAMSLARYLEEKILQDGHAFVLVHPRSYTNVCFYWIPPSMRPFCLERATESEKQELGNVAPRLKSHMQAVGDAMIGFQPLGSWPNFFRIVFASAWTLQVKDLDLLLKRMDDYGTQLYSE